MNADLKSPRPRMPSSRRNGPASSNPRGNSEESRVALSELCEAYYSPVLAFVRVQVRDEDRARDLTQEFFARLLKKMASPNSIPPAAASVPTSLPP